MLLKDFEKKWLSSFANGISKKDIEKYVISTENFIWHVFSWELLPTDSYLVGDEARKAYNELSRYKRENALYIEPFENEETFSLLWQDSTCAPFAKFDLV